MHDPIACGLFPIPCGAQQLSTGQLSLNEAKDRTESSDCLSVCDGRAETGRRRGVPAEASCDLVVTNLDGGVRARPRQKRSRQLVDARTGRPSGMFSLSETWDTLVCVGS